MRSYGRSVGWTCLVVREYVLDTGAANLVAMRHPRAATHVVGAKQVYLPIIALAELYHGGSWRAYEHQSTKYLDRCDALLNEYRMRLLLANAETAHYYGAIRAELRSKGVVIQHTDLWVAALAKQLGLTIAATDHHVGQISGITLGNLALNHLALQPPNLCKTGTPSRVLPA